MTNSKINSKIKTRKTRKLKKRHQNNSKNQKGGVKYSAGGTPSQNQILDFIFPDKEEKQIEKDIKFPYNASFNKERLLGVDFRFYLPKASKTESKYNYSIDDYMNVIRVSKDVPRTDPRYNKLRDYVKRIIEKDPETYKISYFDAIYLIMNGDPELGEIKCATKKRDDKDYGEIKEGKELFTALNIDFFDFERESNVRYLNYVFSNPESNLRGESNIKYFIISSNTSEFYKAVYTTFLLTDTAPQQQQNTNIGISLTGDDESCQYVRCCFTILLFCLLLDNLTNIESEKIRILNEITTERTVFVEEVKKLLKTQETTEEKKTKHREYFHEYTENVYKSIKSFSLFRSNNDAPIKFPEIGEKDLYYLLVTNDSYSNLNSIIAKYTTPKFMDLIEKHELPFELVITQELMGKENIKSEKITHEYERQINEVFNIKKESITDYIKNGVTTVVSMNEKKEIIAIQKIVFGIYLRIPGKDILQSQDSPLQPQEPVKDKILLAIFIDEKTINITKNYILDFAKLRWVLKKEDKDEVIKAFGVDVTNKNNVLKVMPFFENIIPIGEETKRTSTSYDNAIIMYPGLLKRLMFGLATPFAYTLKNRRKSKTDTLLPPRPPEPQEEINRIEEERESTVSVDSNASTVVN